MSAATKAQHTAAELRFVCLDESGEIAYFESASKSNPSRPNVTAYDIDEDATYCFCKGFECGRQCWHCDHAAAAWRLVAHKVRCQRMTMAELVAHGESLVKYVLDAEAAGQVWLAGNFRQQLDEARVVWQQMRAAEVAARPTVLPVLERASLVMRAA